MTIRHLKVFISVCETGNMTRTAKLLHIAQPAVSYTISELERLSSAKLFERVNKKLVISDFGKELLPKARAAVESFEEFERLAKRGAREESVKIGASITIGKTIIPKILSEIKELYPAAAPFVSINSTKIIADLVANVRKAEALSKKALAELEAGNYTSEYKYIEMFGREDYVYTLNKGTELKAEMKQIYTEFSHWLGSYEM